MPQTYIRAVRSGSVATTSPRAVSCSLRPGPAPGRVGSGGAGQASTTPSLEAATDARSSRLVLRSRSMELDEYLPVLQRTNARFAEAAAETVLAHGWGARVPGCPDWDLAGLVWHLAEVQHFWAWVVRTRAQDPSGYPEPARRPDDELLAFL